LFSSLQALLTPCSAVIVSNIQIGWPSSLPTNEKGVFTKSVLKEKVNVLTLNLEELYTSND
jgi:hypothetical protein